MLEPLVKNRHIAMISCVTLETLFIPADHMSSIGGVIGTGMRPGTLCSSTSHEWFLGLFLGTATSLANGGTRFSPANPTFTPNLYAL
jgi:hypothetical protein